MTESIKASVVLQASAERLYKAWLSGKEHSAFTGGGAATVEPKVGGKFTAWDGYIEGKTLALEPCKRIVQSWRTSDFPPKHPDSKLEILFEEAKGGTKLSLVHTGIPDGQGQGYKDGWKEFYFDPMKKYFGRSD